VLAAWLLTGLACGGVVAGVLLGQSHKLSSPLAAIGGALLVGIALFLLLPEIAERSGWAAALGLSLAALAVLAALDRLLTHGSHSPADVIGPLLVATAVHSFLDGWSVRALSMQAFANIAVPLGLALHKAPEGLALGLIARKSMISAGKALAAGCCVEAVTLVGALIQPRVDQSAAAQFGYWWTTAVMAIIAGSFLLVGLHALIPSRRKHQLTS
jgi:zinc transporter ZupT